MLRIAGRACLNCEGPAPDLHTQVIRLIGPSVRVTADIRLYRALAAADGRLIPVVLSKLLQEVWTGVWRWR